MHIFINELATWYLLYPRSTKLKGGILVSPCPSVCPSICGQKCSCSVSCTIVAGSTSCLHILLSNFRKCAACNFFLFFQNSKIRIFGKFFKFVTLTLSYFDLGSNMSWSTFNLSLIMGRRRYPPNAGVLVVLVDLSFIARRTPRK